MSGQPTEATFDANIPVLKMDSDDTETIAKLLRSACSDVGFFYLEGHGLSDDLLEKVMNQSKKLFGLSVRAKEAIRDEVMSRGYTAMEEETLDPAHQKKGDTKEGFYIGKDIAKDDPRYNPAKLTGPNCWPTEANTRGEFSSNDCEEFRSVMGEYFEKMCDLGFRMTRLIALALGLENDHFDKEFLEPMAVIRLLHYAKETSKPEKGVFACGAHSDYGMITLLLTDHQPGLQIKYNGDWVAVPPRPRSFVINLGDMLERWSNGLFKSTLHRVLTSGDKERYSIPFFYEPSFDTVVVCLPTCCSNDNPAKYPPITSGQHLLNKYSETHADFQPNNN